MVKIRRSEHGRRRLPSSSQTREDKHRQKKDVIPALASKRPAAKWEEQLQAPDAFPLCPVPGVNTKGVFYTYILLDPRVTGNIPYKLEQLRDTMHAYSLAHFHALFVQSIFCVAVGQADWIGAEVGARTNWDKCRNQRMVMAKREYLAHHDIAQKLPADIARICDIWDSGYGVVLLPEALYIGHNEAVQRCRNIVHALCGIVQKLKTTSACQPTWKSAPVRQLSSASPSLRPGKLLLRELFQTLVRNGERQEFPDDVLG
ncbi:uncharacterized protein LOC129594931 [Paramacrobiotus metropolitanus]|uniref:uncharacterized protein LOC129594931 n=1 Tax=Paramacrobiotus metropolitanus TaxID=2943436 RepID=UPI002445A8AB|nr:uncharacterized protein LOC129594931 [Paramacrobiotus metropolitanus]